MDAKLRRYLLERAARRRGCSTTDSLPAWLAREEYIAALHRLAADSLLVAKVRHDRTVFFFTWLGREELEKGG